MRDKKYDRKPNPPGMRLTDRDKRILEAIHAYDGMLGDYQIQALEFESFTRTVQRMRLLFYNSYVNRPGRKHRAALPCMIYWLDKRGAAVVAGRAGEEVKHFRWREKPPKMTLMEHHLAVNDVRIAVVKATDLYSEFGLEEWVPEGEFRAYPDQVEYVTDGRTNKRYIIPDGYFVIRHAGRRFRFLLELDRAHEDNPRFVREKVVPGLSYIQTEAYVRRFGHRSGMWLVVTTDTRRRDNMKRHTEQAVGQYAQAFCFTTFDEVHPETVLTAPIWYRGGDDEPLALSHITMPVSS